LEQAQLQYKSFYNCKHRLVEFTVGAWVWLRLLHRPMASVNVQDRGKLGPKFYGPFLITERIDDVAYRLQLPVGAKLHDVFHIGLLKKYNGDPPLGPGVLPSIRHGCACPVPGPVIRGCLARGHHELLMHWIGQDSSDTTWKDLEEFQRLYPTFKLQDELHFEGGRDVMVSLRYVRQNRGAKGAEAGNELGMPT
jgi:hypothetical protein